MVGLDARTNVDKSASAMLELASVKLSDRILGLPGWLTDDSTGHEALRSKAPVLAPAKMLRLTRPPRCRRVLGVLGVLGAPGSVDSDLGASGRYADLP